MSVLGNALASTVFLEATFSYRSDFSSSFCRSLSVDESWSEMVVRYLLPLFRCHSLAMLRAVSICYDPVWREMLTKSIPLRRSRKSSAECP
jgi:hypothetical protein